MIRLEAIRFRYPRSGWVLKGIDLTVAAGEYVCICGCSGSGKSTLGYICNGLIPHFFEGTLEGKATVGKTDTRTSSVTELFTEIGLVLQNSDAQLFNSSVENEIAFGLESLGLPGPEIDRRIDEVARTLGLEPLLERTPMTLSGGEKRLVAIASVLALEPSVLLLDEPYAQLDWKGMQLVRRTLAEIHRCGTTIIAIEHLTGDFLQDTTRCLILDRGRICFDGPPQRARAALREKHLVPRYPYRKKPRPASQRPLLTVADLTCRLSGKTILKDVSFAVHHGETIAIVGRNGSGKTTLIKHCNGLLKPTAGTVLLDGENIKGKSPLEMAGRVGLAFQNCNDQFFKYRVEDEVLAGPRLLGKADSRWIEELYTLFDLHKLLDRSPYRLSEGEKKRVALASILAMQPRILILDEPTVGQDGFFRETLAELLGKLEQRGLTTILVTHDLEFAHATADRWLVLQDGRLVADGIPDELLRDRRLFAAGALGAQANPSHASLSA